MGRERKGYTELVVEVTWVPHPTGSMIRMAATVRDLEVLGEQSFLAGKVVMPPQPSTPIVPAGQDQPRRVG